jgi:hypothetical protein
MHENSNFGPGPGKQALWRQFHNAWDDLPIFQKAICYQTSNGIPQLLADPAVELMGLCLDAPDTLPLVLISVNGRQAQAVLDVFEGQTFCVARSNDIDGLAAAISLVDMHLTSLAEASI